MVHVDTKLAASTNLPIVGYAGSTILPLLIVRTRYCQWVDTQSQSEHHVSNVKVNHVNRRNIVNAERQAAFPDKQIREVAEMANSNAASMITALPESMKTEAERMTAEARQHSAAI